MIIKRVRERENKTSCKFNDAQKETEGIFLIVRGTERSSE